MDLRADVHIPFPRPLVFATYRDDIGQLVSFLPNVRGVQVKSRDDNGPVAKLVNEWSGGGDLPAAVRAIVGDSRLSWTDYATWNAQTFRCEWRTETQAFAEALRCAGYNAFLEDGPGATLLQVRGTLDVDARKLRGVPGFLAGKIGSTLETFIGGKVSVNIVETANALTRYLQSKI